MSQIDSNSPLGVQSHISCSHVCIVTEPTHTGGTIKKAINSSINSTLSSSIDHPKPSRVKGSLTDLFANLGDDSRAATTRGIKKTRLDCKPVDLMNF